MGKVMDIFVGRYARCLGRWHPVISTMIWNDVEKWSPITQLERTDLSHQCLVAKHKHTYTSATSRRSIVLHTALLPSVYS